MTGVVGILDALAYEGGTDLRVSVRFDHGLMREALPALGGCIGGFVRVLPGPAEPPTTTDQAIARNRIIELARTYVATHEAWWQSDGAQDGEDDRRLENAMVAAYRALRAALAEADASERLWP